MSSRLKPKVSCVRSLVPKLKKSAHSAILSATSAARGTSIMVPMGISSVPVYLRAFLTQTIVSSIRGRSISSSLRMPTSGIMISGRASTRLRLQAIVASTIAVTCITRISG